MSKIVGELNAEIMKKVIHDRRAKLFAEIVAKTGSKQSVIDRAMQEIESLREQVEKLTKERDALRSRRCEICGYLEHEREHTGCLRVQLAALAEQNEKLKAELKSIDGALNDPRANLTLTTSEIIWELKAQLEKLTKERDEYKSGFEAAASKYRNLKLQMQEIINVC